MVNRDRWKGAQLSGVRMIFKIMTAASRTSPMSRIKPPSSRDEPEVVTRSLNRTPESPMKRFSRKRLKACSLLLG